MTDIEMKSLNVISEILKNMHINTNKKIMKTIIKSKQIYETFSFILTEKHEKRDGF